MEFEPIETQEAFDAAIKERIERAKKEEAKKYSDYDDMKKRLKDFEDKASSSQTDIEKLTALVNDYKGKVDAQERAAAAEKTRAKVAEATGVPASLIVGEDEEAMTAFAQSVAKFAKKPAAPVLEHAGKSAPAGKPDNAAMRDFVKNLVP